MTDSIGRKLESFLPGPILVIFGQWVAPFASSGRLVSTDDQSEGSYLGAAIGLLLSIALRPVLIGKSERVKHVSVVVSLVVTLALLLYCYYIWTILGQALQPPEVQALQSRQFLSFVAAMGFLCLTVSLASLAYPTNYRVIIIIVLVLIVIAVVGIIGYYLWWRHR